MAVFKLLRDSGYTLKILPGTPEQLFKHVFCHTLHSFLRFALLLPLLL